MPDNQILASIVALRDSIPKSTVILVSKDINLRIKATIYGIAAEDYENDRALDDFSLLYTGLAELPADFWDRHGELRSWSERGHTFYEVQAPQGRGLASEPVPVPAGRKRRSSCACCAWTRRQADAADRRRLPQRTTTSGASPRATASRTSRSTR